MKDLLILGVAYFFSRFLWITRYPIFNDESTYLRYGYVMTTVPGQAWYSLVHSGKQPLVYWLYGLSMKFITDPVLAARMITVLIGFVTVIGCYTLGSRIGSRRVGVVAALLVIVSPMQVFFDRLALVDSVLAAICVWLLVELDALTQTKRSSSSILVGALIGLSLWVKSTGFLFALVTLVWMVITWRIRPAFPFWQTMARITASCLLVSLPLTLRPEYSRVVAMAGEYTFTWREVWSKRLAYVPGNMLDGALVIAGYISPVVLGASVFATAYQRKTRLLLLTLSWVVMLGTIFIFGKTVHSRYLLFATIPMVVASASVLSRFPLLVLAAVVPMTSLSLLLIARPDTFFHVFPSWRVFQSESWQYIDGWPSGYGLKEAFALVEADRKLQPAVMTVRLDTGNPEDAVFVYGVSRSDTYVRYLDYRLVEEASEILSHASRIPTYFITRSGQYAGFEHSIILLGRIPKPRGNDAIEVFRVRSL